MKPQKAIEVLEADLSDPGSQYNKDFRAAEQLGIEALKRCKERSDRYPALPHLRLPGETRED